MPRLAGALLSFRARGRVGGHRRAWYRKPVYAPFIMPLIGALVPGVLSTGLKPPEVPYHGSPFTATIFGARVSVAPQVQGITVAFFHNDGYIDFVTIAPNTKSASTVVSRPVVDGDWFEVSLTHVGISPNEGSDLVWLVSGGV